MADGSILTTHNLSNILDKLRIKLEEAETEYHREDVPRDYIPWVISSEIRRQLGILVEETDPTKGEVCILCGQREAPEKGWESSEGSGG